MSMYSYLQQRKNIFTEEGQVMFLAIMDNVHKLLKTSGAFRLGYAIKGVSGSSWDMIACIDRLVELGEITEVTNGKVAGQDRVFVKGNEKFQQLSGTY